jgi:predicted nucleotidyltransferase
MIREIRNIFTEVPDLIEIHGFGSFFRSRNYNDCDLLLIVKGRGIELAETYETLISLFDNLQKLIGISIDITLFTEREVGSGVLLEEERLVHIAKRIDNPHVPNRNTPARK